MSINVFFSVQTKQDEQVHKTFNQYEVVERIFPFENFQNGGIMLNKVIRWWTWLSLAERCCRRKGSRSSCNLPSKHSSNTIRSNLPFSCKYTFLLLCINQCRTNKTTLRPFFRRLGPSNSVFLGHKECTSLFFPSFFPQVSV